MGGELKEFCGLFGVYGVADAAPLIYQGLFALQHRGQEGAGIVVSNGEKIKSAKGLGLVGDVFSQQPHLQSQGHNRHRPCALFDNRLHAHSKCAAPGCRMRRRHLGDRP